VDSVLIEALTSHISVVDAVDNVLETPPSFKRSKEWGKLAPLGRCSATALIPEPFAG